MIEDRYYYSILDKADKEIYKKILEGIIRRDKEIILHVGNKAQEEIINLVQYVNLDNPLIYYVDFQLVLWNIYPNCIGYTPKYLYSDDEIEVLKEKTENAIAKILKRVTKTDDTEKEKQIHDILIENIRYDFNARSHLRKNSPTANTILGVLFYKAAVCEGIAKLTKVLLNRLDIKCIVAAGNEKNDKVKHAWNVVKINDNAYHLDVTYDLGCSIGPLISYRYFNVTAEKMRRERDFFVKYP